MTRGLDFRKAQAALERAAHKALHGTRQERSGRFVGGGASTATHGGSGAAVGPRSSTMTHIAYDDERQELEITFVSGKTYRYQSVPRAVFASLMETDSRGRFFNTQIRGRFGFREVVGEPRRG